MKEFNFIIEKINGDKEGKFVWGNNYSKLFDQYYDASEIYESGDYEKAINKFRYLIKKDSSFFPAMNDIGWSFIEKNKYSKALGYYEMAYKIANEKIPRSFNGKIIWGYVDNRHYLRTLHGLGMALYYSHKYEKAIKIFEQILEYNPNDNQGIRYLIGDLYLTLGENIKAEESFVENLDSPSIRYSYGLLLHNSKRFSEAIMQFALAIIEDEYIYKFLVNEKIDEPKDFFTVTKIKDAYDYYSFTFLLWFNNKSIETLYKLYHSDTFSVYLEEITRLRKKLTEVYGVANESIEKRSVFLDRISEIINIIDYDFGAKIFNEINQTRS